MPLSRVTPTGCNVSGSWPVATTLPFANVASASLTSSVLPSYPTLPRMRGIASDV